MSSLVSRSLTLALSVAQLSAVAWQHPSSLDSPSFVARGSALRHGRKQNVSKDVGPFYGVPFSQSSRVLVDGRDLVEKSPAATPPSSHSTPAVASGAGDAASEKAARFPPLVAHSAHMLASGAAPATSAAASAAPAGAPASGPAASTGLCGCERKTQDCTCGGWLEYLQCVSKRCTTGKCDGQCPAHPDAFMAQCEAVQRQECGDELQWTCGPHEAACQGKFHQLRDSMLGLEVDTEHLGDDAFCGPWGKCQGELHLTVDVHNPAPDLSVQCSLPLEANASFGDRSLWQACTAEVPVNASRASCSMPMVPKLAAGTKLDGKCWLLNKDGEKMSKNAWFIVQNHYKGDITPIYEEHKRAEAETLQKSRSFQSHRGFQVLAAVLTSLCIAAG